MGTRAHCNVTRDRATALIAAASASTAFAASAGEVQFGLINPETIVAHQIQDLHTIVLWICIVIGLVVFGLLFYTLARHRRSIGHEAKLVEESKALQVAWTLIPLLIVVGMAFPATRTVIAMKDTSNPDLTIKITGYQWHWRYDYLGKDISFYSVLSTPRGQIENQEPKGENYLLEVDNPMVVPVDKKVRILVTANDVIHSWWVPAFGVKQDAIPGFVRDAWFKVDAPGVYRGQCAELCGKEHGYMPIVVQALPDKEFETWLATQEARSKAAGSAAAADAGKTYSLDELKTQGQAVYDRSCAACHQPNGQGVPPTFPPIAHGVVTTGPLAAHLDMVLHGSKKNPAMAAFGGQLSDLEIAAVVTYERNAFGNTQGDTLQPRDVAAARK
ncbi:MAG TPA: cytochrome c oxidase subunit II [Gammaproteobacteria bacterium]|nr:cytochrome c oxidase subunit II [Gammaproteobacteria bacterium]